MTATRAGAAGGGRGDGGVGGRGVFAWLQGWIHCRCFSGSIFYAYMHVQHQAERGEVRGAADRGAVTPAVRLCHARARAPPRSDVLYARQDVKLQHLNNFI